MTTLAEVDQGVQDLATAMGAEVNGRALADLSNVDPAAIAAALGSQSANRLYAGPASGASAEPDFRAMVAADLPALPTFAAHRNGSNQTIASGSFVKLQCGTEEWDVGGCYDSATNYRFTPTTPGKYLITANAFLSPAAPASLICSLFKNGSEIKRGAQMQAPAGDNTVALAAIVAANGADYFEVFVFQTSGSNATLNGAAAQTWVQGAFVCR